MKKYILNIILIMTLCACNSSDEPEEIQLTPNKVLLLQIDYLTYDFEGGFEFEFQQSSSFTITSTYDPPFDLGNVKLYYDEINELIFDGDIYWSGSGYRNFPEELVEPSIYAVTTNSVPLPNTETFQKIMYDESDHFYPDTINYSEIWNAINNLELVENYLISNPDGIINLFLHTSSVGGNQPSDWNWYLILKN
jgi:hypothetical protein